jgi:hypothetical protein
LTLEELWLAWNGPSSHYGWFNFGWLQVKLAVVVLLSAVHGLLARWVKVFAAEARYARYPQDELVAIVDQPPCGSNEHEGRRALKPRKGAWRLQAVDSGQLRLPVQRCGFVALRTADRDLKWLGFDIYAASVAADENAAF